MPNSVCSDTDRVAERGTAPLLPLEMVRQLPFEPFASSAGRPWNDVAAVRFRDKRPDEVFIPALTHHWLMLFLHTPDDFGLLCEGVSRDMPPPAGAIQVVPAGLATRWRWGLQSDSLHVFLEPALVSRVAEEEFELDSARGLNPPLDGVVQPQLHAALLAIGSELTNSACGDRLATESLANLIAVHLTRIAVAPPKKSPPRDGLLAKKKLRVVLELIDARLEGGLSLKQLAAAAHLSPYHFARQFKATTGVAPHQFVIARRIERAQQLLRNGRHSLSDVATRVGFTDQSQFSRHFKRALGVTPRQFHLAARSA